MEVGETIPSAAIPLAVFVLVFSLISLLFTLLLLCMQWKHSARLSMISLAAIVIAISIIVSMMQQIHFMIDWKSIRDAAYENAKRSQYDSSLTIASTFNVFDDVVSQIRFYCYNVQSLLFLFWTIGLWHATRNAKLALSQPKDKKLVLGSKIFALVFPIPIIGSIRTEIVMTNFYTRLLWSNLVLIISTTTGSIFLILILSTYVHVRRITKRDNRCNKLPPVNLSFRVNRSDSCDSGLPTRPAQASSVQSMSYDRWLIARFLVCFALSNIFQICVMTWYVLVYQNNRANLEKGGPDYSLKGTLKYLGITLPGVSSGIVIFFVFGTTAQFRSEYKRWLQPCRRKCQGRAGPIMVAPLASPSHAPPVSSVDVERGLVTESARPDSTSSLVQTPPVDFENLREKAIILAAEHGRPQK